MDNIHPNSISFNGDMTFSSGDTGARMTPQIPSTTIDNRPLEWSKGDEDYTPLFRQLGLDPDIPYNVNAPTVEYPMNDGGMASIDGHGDDQNPARALPNVIRVLPFNASIPNITSLPDPVVTGEQVGGPPLSTKRFKCVGCPNRFARRARAEACKNKHDGVRPYKCQGKCGASDCEAAYFRKSDLSRHCRSVDTRKMACELCERSILRQNMSRHKKQIHQEN